MFEMKMALIQLLILLSLLGQISSQLQRDFSAVACASTKTLTTLPNGEKKCCNKECCDSCPPGYFVVGPCIAGRRSMCGQCAPGSFSSGKYGSIDCTECARCDTTDHINLKDCTTEQDTVCPCALGKFLTAHLDCQSCTKCGKGDGMVASCTNTTDTKCEKCPDGYFSNTTSFDTCKKCKSCPKSTRVTRECNGEMDSECQEIKEEKPMIPRTTFITVVISLSCVIVCCIICFILFLCGSHRSRPRQRALLIPEKATEECCQGSSVGTLDQEKRVIKYIQGLDGQSFSTRSSLCSDRPRLLNPNMRLDKVEASLIQQLSFCLNPRCSYKDWTGLAGLMGYTLLEIDNLRLCEGSFTEALLNDFTCKKPKLATLNFLYEKLVDLEREDAADLIVEYDKKVHNERTETPV